MAKQTVPGGGVGPLHEAIARAIGSPTLHDTPAAETWWMMLSERERHQYLVKAVAVLRVVGTHLTLEIEALPGYGRGDNGESLPDGHLLPRADVLAVVDRPLLDPIILSDEAGEYVENWANVEITPATCSVAAALAAVTAAYPVADQYDEPDHTARYAWTGTEHRRAEWIQGHEQVCGECGAAKQPDPHAEGLDVHWPLCPPDAVGAREFHRFELRVEAVGGVGGTTKQQETP